MFLTKFQNSSNIRLQFNKWHIFATFEHVQCHKHIQNWMSLFKTFLYHERIQFVVEIRKAIWKSKFEKRTFNSLQYFTQRKKRKSKLTINENANAIAITMLDDKIEKNESNTIRKNVLKITSIQHVRIFSNESVTTMYF